MNNKDLAIKFLKREYKIIFNGDEVEGRGNNWDDFISAITVLEFAKYLDRKEAREKK